MILKICVDGLVVDVALLLIKLDQLQMYNDDIKVYLRNATSYYFFILIFNPLYICCFMTK